MIVTRLSDDAGDTHLSGANSSRERLLDVTYALRCVQIADGLRPSVPVEDSAAVPRHGWHFRGAQAMDDCRHGMVPRLCDTQQALGRSKSGPLTGVPFTCFTSSPLTRLTPVCGHPTMKFSLVLDSAQGQSDRTLFSSHSVLREILHVCPPISDHRSTCQNIH